MMENNLKEMRLVEGEVVFRTRVALLVPKDIAQDEERVKELLEEKAQDDLGMAEEVEYDNEVPVLVSTKTAMQYTYETLGDVAWKEIIEESKKNEASNR